MFVNNQIVSIIKHVLIGRGEYNLGNDDKQYANADDREANNGRHWYKDIRVIIDVLDVISWILSLNQVGLGYPDIN